MTYAEWHNTVQTLTLTLLFHSEPFLKGCVFEQEVEQAGKRLGIRLVAPQLLLKLQHLLHQVTKEDIIVQQPGGVTGHLLLDQTQQASTQLYLHASKHRSLTGPEGEIHLPRCIVSSNTFSSVLRLWDEVCFFGEKSFHQDNFATLIINKFWETGGDTTFASKTINFFKVISFTFFFFKLKWFTLHLKTSRNGFDTHLENGGLQ